MTADAYIAIGSNLGDREGTIDSAIESLGALGSITILAVSTIIETEPVGPAGQGAYLNGVIHARCELGARELLAELLAIEQQHGRDRQQEERWGARTLDLDLLLLGDVCIDEPGLCVPHPRLHERSFVLIPLCEIAPDIFIPGLKKTPQALLGALSQD